MKEILPLKILYFITTLDIGGAEQLLLLTLKNINRKKYEPTVCCFYKGKLADEIESLGIRVVDLKTRSKFNLLSLFRLYKFLKKEKFDIMHTHLFHANIIGRIMARLCKITIVISTQHYAFKYNGNFGIYLEKLTAKLSDRIIAVSEAARRFYISEIGIPENKIMLIYNGVDLDMLKCGDVDGEKIRKQLSLNDNFIIGCIGNFTEVKGHIYLLKAMAEVLKIENRIKVLLIGCGSQENYLRNLAKDLGILKNVIFLDRRRDIPQILASFDICVLPSLQEGLSIILLEALAMGKPVIATAVGGNIEVIEDGESGVLVPCRDYKAITKAIIRLLKDREKARQLGMKGRQRAMEQFNIKDNVYRTELLYEELLNNK